MYNRMFIVLLIYVVISRQNMYV